MARKFKIQLRRDTAANWTSADPTLAAGECGFETDTGALKIGDGATAWTGLGYATGGSGAPTGADYLVGTANGSLSAEIVVGTTPGGELGNTWASPTVDATHSGSAHADFIAKAFLDAKGDLISASADNTPAIVTVGADDTILMADAAAAAGLKWASPATPSTQAFGDVAAAGTGDTFTRGDHKHAMPADPTTGIRAVDVLVGTATGEFSGEIVAGTSPGGELGGTWASPTVDATHSGSAHHDAVTVGTGLDVTGQLVELDLSEVSAGGELAGTMDAPTVDQDHGGEYLGGDGDISVADTNYVTIATKTLTLAAGDVLIVECDFLILNNSGGTKTYTYALDVGGFLCENVDGTTQGASATNRAYRTFRASFALRSTSLAYSGVTVQWMAAAAANTSANPALAQMRGTWNTTASNLTGSQAISVKVKASANNATQTLTLLGWRIRKAT